MLLPTLLLALSLAPPLQGATPDEAERARDAVRAVRDAEGRGTGALVQQTLAGLAGHDHPISVDMLLALFDDASPALHATARQVLASYTDPQTLAHVQSKGLDHRQGDVRAQVLLALADGRPTGIDWGAAAESALDDPVPGVRAAALFALGRARRVQALPRVVDLAQDASERVRAAVPGAVTRLAERRALPLLETLSSDPAWRVRLSVIEALRDVKSRGAVELLIDMLEVEPGRLREDVIEALVRLTGRNYGEHADAWRAWLARAPESFLSDGDGAVIEPPTAQVTQTVARYYGLTTMSRRFCLVTDVSTSMDHVDGGRYGDGRLSRLDVTKAQLNKLLDGLQSGTNVQLITFSDHVQRQGDGYDSDDPRDLKRARSQVAAYHTLGGTNVFEALEQVFDLAEADIDQRRVTRPSPDTVFLLTDGAPSAGEIQDPELLLAYAAERNRTSRLRFHTVALTRDDAAREFLRRLARQTGGQWVAPQE